MLYCIRIKEDPAVSRAEMIHLCPFFAGKNRFLGTACMALFANYPFALAPGIYLYLGNALLLQHFRGYFHGSDFLCGSEPADRKNKRKESQSGNVYSGGTVPGEIFPDLGIEKGS